MARGIAFSFTNRRFEAPRDLRGKKIQIRFDRARTDSPVAVFFKGERMGQAQPLDPVANDRKPKIKTDNRTTISATTTSNSSTISSTTTPNGDNP